MQKQTAMMMPVNEIASGAQAPHWPALIQPGMQRPLGLRQMLLCHVQGHASPGRRLRSVLYF